MVKYTVVTAPPQLIAGGESIVVTKIVISSNFAPISVDIFERDGTTLIVNLKVTAGGQNGTGQNFEMTTGFLAPRGVVVSGAPCTIWYNQGGA